MAISKNDINTRVAVLIAKGYTEEEAELLVKEDMMIDAGETCDWETELTDEQAKVSRQARQASREVSDTTAKRKRAEDPDKRALMRCLVLDLAHEDQHNPPMAENIVVLNPEREIEFYYNGRKFKLTLSAPRS